jgi:polysaccharide chain length determinant protein (PEP-CTERM system associated)
LGDYWLMVRRRRKLLVLSWVAIFIGTVFLSIALPDIYRASTVILVEAQQVPESYVRSTVASSVQERLRTITQQIKSRTRLEQVIRELRPRDDLQDIETDIGKMSRSIEVEVKGNAASTAAFIVSYVGKDPRTVMLVTNKLASLFIEENAKVRERLAIGTTDFLGRELQRVRALLEAQEKAISEFKQRYMGELPEEQSTNLRTLDRLQAQLQTNMEAMGSARNRKSLLLQQFSLLPSDVTLDTNTNSLEQQLTQRHEALAALQQLHTDAYPDVIRLKREVAELQAKLAAHRSRPPVSERPQPTRAAPGSLRWRLQEEINQVDLEVEKLRLQQESVREQIAAYEKKVANAAQREQELQVLTRDYESTQKNYASLSERQMQAKIAENLEKRQKAEQFQVLDPAPMPTKPWKPDRFRILIMGLMLGLGVGCGAVFLAENLDRSFHDPEDLKQFTTLPVLVSIPLLTTAAEQRQLRLKRRLSYAACVFIPVVTIAAVHLFWIRVDLLFAHTLQLLRPWFRHGL